MKKLAIISLLLVFTLIGCANPSKSEPVPTSTTPSTSTTESKACVEHDFAEATLVRPRTCLVCEATEGEALYIQCETWDDVVSSLYFGEYPHELRVKQNGDGCLLFIEFNDAAQFITEDSIKEFMVNALASLREVSGFVRGDYLGTSINTPIRFRGDTAVTLIVPGGRIVCSLTGNNMFGIYTVLVRDEASQNADILESVYNSSFGSLGVDIG